MTILIVKHKADSGVGPANGHPAGQVAHIFDTFKQAHEHIKKVEKFPMFDGARIFDGDEDIEDHRETNAVANVCKCTQPREFYGNGLTIMCKECDQPV